MTVSHIPEHFHAVNVYLTVNGAVDALAFYKSAFGAEEILRLPMPDGRLGHAEIRIGDSTVMLADEFPDMGCLSPQTLGGTGVNLCIYVEDCDALFARALEAGAEELRPLQDQFYGDRSGTVKDPFGHTWTIATHIEDLDEAELARRAEQAMAGT